MFYFFSSSVLSVFLYFNLFIRYFFVVLTDDIILVIRRLFRFLVSTVPTDLTQAWCNVLDRLHLVVFIAQRVGIWPILHYGLRSPLHLIRLLAAETENLSADVFVGKFWLQVPVMENLYRRHHEYDDDEVDRYDH